MSTANNVAQWSTTAATNSNVDTGLPVMSDTMDPIGLDNVPRSIMAAIARWRKDFGGAIDAGGTANALTASTNSGDEASHLVDGLMIVVRAAADNTSTTVTLNVDTRGVLPVKRSDGSDLAVGSIKSGAILLVFYDASNAEWWIANIGPATGVVADLASAITPTDGVLLVGDGTTFVGESGATLRTSIGLGTGNSPQFTGIELGHASDTTLARASAGDMNIEGNIVYRAGGTDVPVTDGGTGASTAAAARSNLAAKNGKDAAFRVTKSATQSLSSGTAEVTWNTEGLDTGSCFASNRWTPPAGPVFLSAVLSISPNASSPDVRMAILKNGSSSLSGATAAISLSVNGPTALAASVVDVANGTDYYSVFVGSDAAIVIENDDIITGSWVASSFTGMMIGGP